jgi:hypothetical protein
MTAIMVLAIATQAACEFGGPISSVLAVTHPALPDSLPDSSSSDCADSEIQSLEMKRHSGTVPLHVSPKAICPLVISMNYTSLFHAVSLEKERANQVLPVFPL